MPVRAELLATTADLGGRLNSGLQRLVERRKTELRAAARALPSPENLLAQPRQRLDIAVGRLPEMVRRNIDKRRISLSRLSTGLAEHSPRALLGKRRERLNALGERLANGLTRRLGQARIDIGKDRERLARISDRLPLVIRQHFSRHAERLSGAGKLLRSLSHEGVLERGFALVLNESGHPVRKVDTVAAGDALTIQVSDGRFGAFVTDDAEPLRFTKPGKKSAEIKKLAEKPLNDLFG